MIVQEINGIPHVIDSCFYPVRANSPVTLSVEVGDFQAGGTSYSWKGQVVTGTPNFEDRPVNAAGVGVGSTTLHCLTKVVDIRPDTNQTSVTYTLKGGVQDRTYPYGIAVTKDHGMAVYQVTFVFVEQAQ
jgi:hypothetical protein